MRRLTTGLWISGGVLLSCLFAMTAWSSEARVAPLLVPGLENTYQVADRFFSGSQPAGSAGFASLQKLGIKTIISVDGTKPDVEQAERFGLRYVHLPQGYDGISSNKQLRLIKAVQTLPGPFYVHCHHGKHRGPAAVAILCQATAGWTAQEGLAWLHQAGTGLEYPGLFQASAGFRLPIPEALASVSTNFPARVEVSSLVDAMVEIDQRWDHLQALRKAKWRVPPDHSDLVPKEEAALLREGFQELARNETAEKKGADFLEKLRQAENAAEALRVFLEVESLPLNENRLAQADELAKAAAQSCSTCHIKYRN